MVQTSVVRYFNGHRRERKSNSLPGASRRSVIPNPWDAGSARIFAGLGFRALATSSAAAACARGRKDGELTRDEALSHARTIVEATDLPVSADLEKGFGDAPEVVAETIRLAAKVGLVGCTIEDATCNADHPLYDFGVRIKGKSFSVSELASVGVRRISLATSLYRAAMTGFLDAAREAKDAGQFNFLDRCVTTAELNNLMST